MDNIKKAILDFFEEKDIDVENIGDNDDILFSGIIDSFQIVELIMFLEQEFNIKFKDEDINEVNFKTIANIMGLVSGKLN